ncbi:MAG: rod shape-determining protein MreC [Candidatus Eremiobacteraeota bacterium]|nr:rod shape-determining protein MreC [Candidatus Eremiobacteraeota bacterium]
MIVAALIALVQLDAAKTGKPSLIALGVSSGAVWITTGVASLGATASGLGRTLADAPHLYDDNAQLRAQNQALRSENERLQEAVSTAPDALAIARTASRESGIVATTIGYDPENLSRVITLDRGTDAGVRRDDGVVNDEGVVGRVVDALPAMSSVLLVTDGASKIPAVIRRGRWWGIATGTNSRVRLDYVSQDARLRIGDVVVTGEGRSFHAGLVIGRVVAIDHPEGSLYQSALVEPAVSFGRISHVLVVHR